MSFNVSSLTDYTQKATELLREGILFSDSYAGYSVQTGIKYREPMNILDTEVYFQAGTCGLGNSGDTTFTEKLITVVPYAVKKSFCEADLRKKNLPLVPGSMMDKLSPEVESVLTADLQAKTKNKIDADLWLGTSTMIDGWMANVSGCTDAISLTTYSSTTPTLSNIDDIVNDFVDNITDAMWSRGELTLHCSVAVYNLYKRNIYNAYGQTLAAFNEKLGPMEMYVANYDGQIKIKAESGLNGSEYMLLTWDKNLYIGMDEENEISYAKYVFDEVEDYIWYKQYFKLGTQVAFCGEVIHNMY